MSAAAHDGYLVQMNVRVPFELQERVRETARDERTSVQAVVTRALDAAISTPQENES